MRQAIATKYHGATNFRGSRVKAVARKRIEYSSGITEGELALTDSWDHGSNPEENHCRVAKLLAAKLNWHGLWVGGGSPDNTGYVFVNVADAYAGAPTESIGMENRDWFYVERKDQ